MTSTVLRRTPPQEWRRTGPSLIDEEETHGSALPTKKRRGRPIGAKGKTTTDGKKLSAADFSFLRATLEGVELGMAAKLYLPEIPSPEISAYKADLVRRVQLGVNAGADDGGELRRLCEIAQLTTAEPTTPPSTVEQHDALPPSLEEFSARFEEDMYSQAQLEELYLEEFGTFNAPESILENKGGAPHYDIATRVQALHSIQALLVPTVSFSDPISLWFDLKLAEALKAHNVLSVADLAKWVNKVGVRWYERVDGVGRTRARRVVAWLAANEIGTGVALSSSFKSYLGERSGDNGEDKRYLVPLDLVEWPSDLTGASGTFRSALPNTLKANNDQEAVFAWLQKIGERSIDTRVAYRRAIERLVLWALFEKKRALSSLSTNDIVEFKNFLMSPPKSWVATSLRMKSSCEWRPLRGPAREKTLILTMSAISKMFKDWHSANYLLSNAVSLVTGVSRKEMRFDEMRSFSDQDLECIAQTLMAMPDSPNRRRLRATLLLLQTAGLRRSEAASLTWKQVIRLREENRDVDQWAIKFIGKGKRERIVPIQHHLMEALSDHYKDRLSLIESGKLSYYTGISKDDSPLLSILDERLAMSAPGSEGDAPHNAARTVNAVGRLSTSRLFKIVKQFFREVAAKHKNTSADFQAASTHWLRHTFAHQVLIATTDLAVTQQLLGHANISTTALYVKAEMKTRINAINKISPLL